MSRSVDYGEADRVLTLLTREAGKVAVLARGARRSRRRFGAALDLFVVGQAELRLRPGGRLAALERFDPHENYGTAIARDVIKVAHGSYMLELARELWPAGQREPEVFALLVDGFAALAAVAPTAGLLRAFELQLLRALGLVPLLDRCVACGVTVGSATCGFSVADGGVICATCGPTGGLLSTVGREALLHLRDRPLSEAAEEAAPAPLQRELRDLMQRVVQHHLGRRPRALEFLIALQAGSAHAAFQAVAVPPPRPADGPS
ncbi:MAG: DNA repair protein RecO [Proteobacteria bacterium]|nr:DNA repair protein RecO [Pseudomonadota bacterium]